MNTNDALARLRQLLPTDMDAVDRMLARAGFIDSAGRVSPGCDDSVRSLTITQIPHANEYFHLLAPHGDTAATAGHSDRLQQLGGVAPQ
jgi:hypothetical protein